MREMDKRACLLCLTFDLLRLCVMSEGKLILHQLLTTTAPGARQRERRAERCIENLITLGSKLLSDQVSHHTVPQCCCHMMHTVRHFSFILHAHPGAQTQYKLYYDASYSRGTYNLTAKMTKARMTTITAIAMIRGMMMPTVIAAVFPADADETTTAKQRGPICNTH